MKNFRIFHLKTFFFFGGKIYSILNRLVLVMIQQLYTRQQVVEFYDQSFGTGMVLS